MPRRERYTVFVSSRVVRDGRDPWGRSLISLTRPFLVGTDSGHGPQRYQRPQVPEKTLPSRFVLVHNHRLERSFSYARRFKLINQRYWR